MSHPTHYIISRGRRFDAYGLADARYVRDTVGGDIFDAGQSHSLTSQENTVSKKQTITLTGPFQGRPSLSLQTQLRMAGREQEIEETRKVWTVDTVTNTMVQDPGSNIGRSRLAELMAMEDLDVKVSKLKDPTRPELYVNAALWDQL